MPDPDNGAGGLVNRDLLPFEAAPLMRAAMELFERSAELFGIVERAEPYRVLYVNSAAANYAASSVKSVTGLPLTDVFTRAASGPLIEVVRAAAGGRAKSLRGVETRPGVYWNLDAVASDDLILISARPLERSEVGHQRLETLLASTDAIWRNRDASSVARAIVQSAVQLLPGVECTLSVIAHAAAPELEIVAGSADWACVGTRVPLANSYSGKALNRGVSVEGAPEHADESHRGPLFDAGVRVMRVVPLVPTDVLPDGRAWLGALSFMNLARETFDEDERRLMDEFGKRASIALERAELVQAERLNAERHRVAYDSALALSSTLSPEKVIEQLLERVVTSIGAERVTLSTIDDDVIKIEATYAREGGTSTWIGRSYGLDWINAQPLVKQAIETRAPVIGGQLDAAAAAPEFQRHLAVARHTANVPLVRGETVSGLLVVSRFADQRFSDDDVATLSLIGHAAILSLHNARLHDQTVDAKDRAQVLAHSLEATTETAVELVQQLEVPDVTDRLLRRALEVAGAQRAVLLSVEEDEVVVLRGMSTNEIDVVRPGERMRLDELALVRAAFETGAAQQAPEIPLDRLPAEYRSQLERLRWFASVPLRLGEQSTGVLNLSRASAAPFSDEQLQALTLLGQVAALALRNASLFDELREANSAKTDFLNMAAHELRSPISVLRGYVSMLGGGTFGDPPAGWESPLQILESKIEELTKLSDELILAARLQSSASTSRRERIDLVAVVRDAVDGAQPAAMLRGGSVAIDAAVRGISVDADATQIRRVIDNLLINAITYCAGSPQVSVRVGRTDRAATVSVVDNGRGIPKDKWDLVFEQFARIDHPEDRPGQGTGLGLYLARGLARLNGGDVRLVRSQPGAGSEFVLELPVITAPHI